jgi:hypothetical protein
MGPADYSFMKLHMLILPVFLSQAASAQNFLFDTDGETARPRAAAASAAPTASRKNNPEAHPEPPRRPKTMPAQTKPAPAAKAAPARSCSANFKEAIKLVKAVHGADADLSRTGQFSGRFSSYTSQNQFKESGGSLLLSMNIQDMILMECTGHRFAVTEVS